MVRNPDAAIRYSFAINFKKMPPAVGQHRSMSWQAVSHHARVMTTVTNLFEKLLDHCCVTSHHPMTRKDRPRLCIERCRGEPCYARFGRAV